MKTFESVNTDSKRKEIVNGYEITRDEDVTYNSFSGKKTGHTKVWYSVCNNDDDGDMIECFKTLAEARRFAKSL